MADESAHGGALAGRTLGDYWLIARLHEGEAADLYRGEDGQLGRAVAVKVLKDGSDAQAVARFVEAARRMASLDHGNVVRVLASGEAGGHYYLAMPLLKESLRERLAREGIPPVGEAARIVVQAAAGLNAAHTRGFAHGNVSPDTIMFDEAGRVALIDVAAPAGAPGSGAAPAGEQQRPGPAPAAEIAEDIYALGAVLYELLTGEQAVWRVGVDDVSSGLTPPSALNPLVWSALDAVVLRAMAADPAARFADTRLFAQALRATVLVHMHAERISGEMETVKASAVRAPRAAFDAPGAILPSADEAAALQGARRADRQVLAAAVALMLVIALACVGGSVAVMGGFHFPGGRSGYQGPGSGPGVTTKLPNGQIAIVTTTATATPTATPTPLATDTPTAGPPTATPGSSAVTMKFGPMQLKKSSCTGVQSVQNTSPYPVSWMWTSPASVISYSINGAPYSGTPNYAGMTPGQSLQLSVRFNCNATPPPSHVNVAYWQTSNPANRDSTSFTVS